MKKVTKVIAVLSVLVGLGSSVCAQPFLGEKESSERKKRRNTHVKMRILHVQGAVEMGKITKAEGAYHIKAIKYANAFKNANPEWTIFKRVNNRKGQKYGRSTKGQKGRRGYKINNAQRGDRRGKMRSGRRGDSGKVKVVRKNETSALKKIRHKIENIRIKRIKEAAKKGYLGSKKASFLVRKIKSQSRFKDANPEWAKYGKGLHGKRGAKGRRGGMRKGDCFGPQEGRFGQEQK